MKFGKEKLTLEEGLKREWLITNGIGGYSSSTIIGANTRKYHGLLVAPLMPPGNRQVILSKVDESIKVAIKITTNIVIRAILRRLIWLYIFLNCFVTSLSFSSSLHILDSIVL